jgi:amidase
MPGDTLVVEILDIKIPKHGVIATIPKQGILGRKKFKSSTKIVELNSRYANFEQLQLKTKPMIGTIGIAPLGEPVQCGSLGKHGGNMDVKELTAGTRLYLPVFSKGALFAAGDIHAVQADGELCVSAIEVPGEILLKFSVIKGKKPDWPVLETKNSFAFLVCGETLDEAADHASDAAVRALMREMKWSFEVAYMFGSLAVDLKINQVVDPKKGVRAVVSKNYLAIDSIFA